MATLEVTDSSTAAERPRDVDSIPLISRIVYSFGGDKIDLDAIMPPGVDSPTFEPRSSDAFKLSQADLNIMNGKHLDESTGKLTTLTSV